MRCARPIRGGLQPAHLPNHTADAAGRSFAAAPPAPALIPPTPSRNGPPHPICGFGLPQGYQFERVTASAFRCTARSSPLSPLFFLARPPHRRLPSALSPTSTLHSHVQAFSVHCYTAGAILTARHRYPRPLRLFLPLRFVSSECRQCLALCCSRHFRSLRQVRPPFLAVNYRKCLSSMERSMPAIRASRGTA